MAYLVGVLLWVGLIGFCIYNWYSINPNSFMFEIAYFST
ncbi:hypothetical protein SAMN05518846_11438 [Brevibacillus centrosporus]|uniref:Uncharacterized protein n=1 Tax=Brevibacillus centrosporus TaxID=54910 RepID=A0A1I3ZY09_9BACL|nr:hypothetical protein SAMN05518846_11438 [Brevibacillus centrosporus]